MSPHYRLRGGWSIKSNTMQKNIYKHKETGNTMVTSEKLSPEHWEKVNVIKGAKMERGEAFSKSKRKK